MTCNNDYDIAIIGAGPAGLATLSALRETFSLDHLTDGQRDQVLVKRQGSHNRRRAGGKVKTSTKRIAVIDPSGSWMSSWNANFDRLQIQFLRSPALAHPDAFDQTSLLAFSVSRGCDQTDLKASGCSDMTSLRPLSGAHNGLWNMPSTKLFRDFCEKKAQGLTHDFVKDSVSDICQEESSSLTQSSSAYYKLSLATSGKQLRAKQVVLAMGALGKPIIPRGVASIPSDRLLHWKDLPSPTFHGNNNNQIAIPSSWSKILVVGGGLTAVQVAQLALKHKGGQDRKVVLCSRRPLMERHLDIGLEWVDRRMAAKCQSEFYHQPIGDRLALLKKARGGGSVPPCYVREVEALEGQGRLIRMVGDAQWIPQESSSDSLAIDIQGQAHHFDGVIVACGVQPNCRTNPVCQSLLQAHDKKVQAKTSEENISKAGLDGDGDDYDGDDSDNNDDSQTEDCCVAAKEYSGLPLVSEDLEWFPNVFVVGGMAGLNLGPDAGNLMGMRRGATLVANAMGCRSWLRESGNVYANRYSLFEDDDSDSDSDDEEEPREETLPSWKTKEVAAEYDTSETGSITSSLDEESSRV